VRRVNKTEKNPAQKILEQNRQKCVNYFSVSKVIFCEIIRKETSCLNIFFVIGNLTW